MEGDITLLFYDFFKKLRNLILTVVEMRVSISDFNNAARGASHLI